MEVSRKPFQGVYNVVRFNWHFYLLVLLFVLAAVPMTYFVSTGIAASIVFVLGFTLLTTIMSLLVSFYVYDYSNLYQLTWLPDFNNKRVLTLNAGFDETSVLIQEKYPLVKLEVADFYDPIKHTEWSIARARKVYPPGGDCVQISSTSLPFEDGSLDYVLSILSAHEIRNLEERIDFFKEIRRVLKPAGNLIVTEHLRDINNFLAYSVGFLHFHSLKSWRTTFRESQFQLAEEKKNTPFITTFILRKDG